MSDTPRTESFNCYDNGCDNPLHAWGAFSAELERELNAAIDRIKRLEEALEGSLKWIVDLANSGDIGFYNIEEDSEIIAARAALKAKEAKL